MEQETLGPSLSYALNDLEQVLLIQFKALNKFNHQRCSTEVLVAKHRIHRMDEYVRG